MRKEEFPLKAERIKYILPPKAMTDIAAKIAAEDSMNAVARHFGCGVHAARRLVDGRELPSLLIDEMKANAAGCEEGILRLRLHNLLDSWDGARRVTMGKLNAISCIVQDYSCMFAHPENSDTFVFMPKSFIRDATNLITSYKRFLRQVQDQCPEYLEALTLYAKRLRAEIQSQAAGMSEADFNMKVLDSDRQDFDFRRVLKESLYRMEHKQPSAEGALPLAFDTPFEPEQPDGPAPAQEEH